MPKAPARGDVDAEDRVRSAFLRPDIENAIGSEKE